MHEAAFVENIIQVVVPEAEKNQVASVKKIRICAGALSCVVPESLNFYFEFAARETPLEGAELVIEKIPAQARCEACGREFEVGSDLYLLCPGCSAVTTRLISGYELYIADFEGE